MCSGTPFNEAILNQPFSFLLKLLYYTIASIGTRMYLHIQRVNLSKIISGGTHLRLPASTTFFFFILTNLFHVQFQFVLSYSFRYDKIKLVLTKLRSSLFLCLTLPDATIIFTSYQTNNHPSGNCTRPGGQVELLYNQFGRFIKQY